MQDTATLASLFLLPDHIVVEAVYPTESRLTLQISCTRECASCPLCQQPSERIQLLANHCYRRCLPALDLRSPQTGNGSRAVPAKVGRTLATLSTSNRLERPGARFAFGTGMLEYVVQLISRTVEELEAQV